MPSEEPPAERRPRLTPPIADVRRAVRACFRMPRRGRRRRPLVLVALSGGADSLALAAATAFEAPRAGLRAGAVIVDHGLQDASAEVAARQPTPRGPSGSTRWSCAASRSTGEGGPEASARDARYAALDAVAAETGAALVLLGHTLDDQAETVLLGLARGSGTASLAGHARPLGPLRAAAPRHPSRDHAAGLPRRRASSRGTTRTTSTPPTPACACASGCCPCSRPSSGPGVAEALARTAEQLREDDEAFTSQIDEFIEEICEPAEAGIARLGRRARGEPRRPAAADHPARRSRASSASRSRARRRSRSRGSSPTGTVRVRSTCPAACRRRVPGATSCFSTTGSTEVLPHDH